MTTRILRNKKPIARSIVQAMLILEGHTAYRLRREEDGITYTIFHKDGAIQHSSAREWEIIDQANALVAKWG